MSSISAIPGSNFISGMVTESMDGFQTTISGMLGWGVEMMDALLNAKRVISVPAKPKTTADQENPANMKTVKGSRQWWEQDLGQELRTVGDLSLHSEHRPGGKRGRKQSRTGSQYNELV